MNNLSYLLQTLFSLISIVAMWLLSGEALVIVIVLSAVAFSAFYVEAQIKRKQEHDVFKLLDICDDLTGKSVATASKHNDAEAILEIHAIIEKSIIEREELLFNEKNS
jgi:hypothetical protein